MLPINIENIQKVLLECYSKKLCYPKVQNGWSEFNKCFGMCAITSLIIKIILVEIFVKSMWMELAIILILLIIKS